MKKRGSVLTPTFLINTHIPNRRRLQLAPLITIFNLSQISAILSSVTLASGHHRQFDKTEQFSV